jgi:hypothetical protein
MGIWEEIKSDLLYAESTVRAFRRRLFLVQVARLAPEFRL